MPGAVRDYHTFSAPDAASTSDASKLTAGDRLVGVTVGINDSNAGPVAAEILVNGEDELIFTHLEEGELWNGDANGPLSWHGDIVFAQPATVVVYIQNDTGVAVTLQVAIAREPKR